MRATWLGVFALSCSLGWGALQQTGAANEAQEEKAGERQEKPELPELDTPAAGSGERVPVGQRGAAGAPERRDLQQKFPQRSPFLGVWRVTKAVRTAPNSTFFTNGYLTFTKSYLSIQIFQEATGDRRKAFQSAQRTWYVEGGQLITKTLVGVRSGTGRTPVLVESAGFMEKRRFTFLGPRLLRIYQGPGQNFLELTKVEEWGN